MQRTKLLLVDDDRWLLESMASWLGDQGFEVALASTTTQARQKLKSDNFDICLTDVVLEGEDGFTLLKYCKKHHPDLPLLLMTGPRASSSIWSIGTGRFIRTAFIAPFWPA